MFKRFCSMLVVCVAVFGCTKKDSISSATPSNVSSSGDILVGEFGSMTGSEATFGVSTHKGIQLVIDDVNASGGIKGRKIKLLTYDNQGKPEEAASVVKRLVTQDKVVALLGEVASTRSLAAAPIAQENKVPMISPSSTNPKVTEVGNYVFRVCFIDPFQGTVMAKFAREHLKIKKVAILRDMKSDYSLGLADFFTKTFKELGGEIVSSESYQSGETDFKAQLTQIRSTNPEAIFIPGYYTEVGLIARQARQLGIKAPLMGGDGWDSPKLFEIGKDAVNGSYFSNHYTSESTDPQTKEFLQKYKAKYNEVPDGLAAMGYDAARVLIEAIRDEIAKTKDFLGATGKITINDQRNAVKSAVVVKVDGDINRYVTTINP
jgi:branched-chain amino acid transport system substrate-binding protein